MDSLLCKKVAIGSLVGLGVAVSLLAAGCCPTLPGQDGGAVRQLNAETLTAGENQVRLAPGNFQAFEVEALADQDIEVVALPAAGAILGVGFAESPDGYSFSAYPGAELRSRDGRFRVTQRPVGADGTGFRFIGTASAAGSWRFSILTQPRVDLDALGETLPRKCLLENVLLLIYLLNDQPALTGPLAKLLYWAFPELVTLHEPLDIVVRVTTAEAGAFVDPADVSPGGDGSSGGGSGDGGGSGGSDGGSDGGSSGGGGSGGGGGSADGGDTEPPTDVAVQVIAQTGDAVPGHDAAAFTYFGNPVIDDAGRVAFYAAYDGGDGSGGLYVWEDGTLQRIYDDDPAQVGNVPGMGPDDSFGGFTIRWDSGSPHLAWGGNGRLLFVAHVNDIAQPNALLRWRASDGDMLLVSSAELLRQAIPDASADFLPEFYHPGVSDSGLAIFSNRYSYFTEGGSFKLFQRGIFTTDGLTTQEIGVGSVPAQPEFAIFGDKPVLLTTHNADGDFLFQAAYQSSEGDRGVYLLRGDEVFRVLDNAPGRAFPGLEQATQVGAAGRDFDALAIGEIGDIAVETTLTVDGETRETVLRWDGSTWREYRVFGDASPTDLLTGIDAKGQAVVLGDGRPFLGNGRSVLDLRFFLPDSLEQAELTWQTFGGAINNSGRVVLRYARDDAGGGTGLLFWSGRELLIVIDSTQPVGLEAIDAIFPVEKRGPDEVDRVGTVVARPEMNRPGLSGMLNDRDELVFRAGYLGPDGEEGTSDDQQAIFLGRGQ